MPPTPTPTPTPPPTNYDVWAIGACNCPACSCGPCNLPIANLSLSTVYNGNTYTETLVYTNPCTWLATWSGVGVDIGRAMRFEIACSLTCVSYDFVVSGTFIGWYEIPVNCLSGMGANNLTHSGTCSPLALVFSGAGTHTITP
jgi:hypothetical protein